MGFDAKLVFVRSASPVSDVTAVEVPAASLVPGDVVETYDPVTGGRAITIVLSVDAEDGRADVLDGRAFTRFDESDTVPLVTAFTYQREGRP